MKNNFYDKIIYKNINLPFNKYKIMMIEKK